MSDVVRRRLVTLVAELSPPGHATEPEPEHPPEYSREKPSEASDEHTPARAAAPVRSVLARGFEFGTAHLAVVAILGLIGVAWAVFGMSQAKTVAVVPSATPVGVVASATPTPTPEPILVHVVGAVASPGVVRLPPGSRVVDAVQAAGGLAANARTGELNLAAVVSDGAQVVVGTPAQTSEVRGSSPTGSSSGEATVNLNTATADELDSLPGVGPVTAQSIIAWRTKHKRFSRIEELQEVDGIGPKTYAEIAPRVRV